MEKSKDIFHQLRVENKKFNALTKLIKPSKKILKRKRKSQVWHKSLAEIRNQEVINDLILKFRSDLKLKKKNLNWSQVDKTYFKSIRPTVKLTQKTNDRYLKIHQWKKELMSQLQNKKNATQLQKKEGSLKHQIKFISQNEPSSNDYHKLRKRFKEYLYQKEFVLQKKELTLRTALDHIGKAHDLYLFQHKLKQLPNSQKKILLPYIKSIKKHEEKMGLKSIKKIFSL